MVGLGGHKGQDTSVRVANAKIHESVLMMMNRTPMTCQVRAVITQDKQATTTAVLQAVVTITTQALEVVHQEWVV